MAAKKSQGLGTVAERRAAVGDGGSEPSVRRRCELLDISRRAYYYTPQGESPLNLRLMRSIDEIHLARPFMGTRMMTDTLRLRGLEVNRKRIHRLMALMGIGSMAPGPHTSRPSAGTDHKVYPYLLRGRVIDGPNQVWCTDITYIAMARGYMYLTAVMDWWSRYVLSWSLGNTMEVGFCIGVLDEAVERAGTAPLIFNTDQGSQYTSRAFTGRLREHGVAASMDGRGRYLDNIFIERLWRSYKTEEIYLKDYGNIPDLRAGTDDWFGFYNTERPHRSLRRRTPLECHEAPHEFGAREAGWDDLEAIKAFWK